MRLKCEPSQTDSIRRRGSSHESLIIIQQETRANRSNCHDQSACNGIELRGIIFHVTLQQQRQQQQQQEPLLRLQAWNMETRSP